MQADFSHLQILKETLCDLRLKVTKMRRSEPWKEIELETVLKKLKKNKSRDPDGLINDLFKPGTIGTDLKASLLTLMNEIKSKSHIPDFVQWANITSIYKGKGEKLDLENERGIFIVSVFRSILMRLIYNDKYRVINVGLK